MKRRINFIVCSVLMIIGFAEVLFAQVYAHGTITTPSSRVYNCRLEGPESPKSEACKEAVRVGGVQAIYDWNGINQLAGSNHQAFVPDGQLCGGGKESHKGMNLARTDWVSTQIAPDNNGKIEFLYRATAPHSTLYHKLYITREGYDLSQALKWSDLGQTPFCELGNVPLSDINGEGYYRLNCDFPQNRTGQHIIYHVWQRNDSEEAFYACVDVKFGDGNPVPTQWKELGNVSANEDLPKDSKVTFRLFDASGQDKEQYQVVLTDANGTAEKWSLAIADEVNLKSSLVRIGVLDSSGSITPIESAFNNKVYLNSEEQHSFDIDVEKANADGGTGGTRANDTVEQDSGGGAINWFLMCLLALYCAKKRSQNSLLLKNRVVGCSIDANSITYFQSI